MAKLHEQVSVVSAIDDALDGSVRRKPRREIRAAPKKDKWDECIVSGCTVKTKDADSRYWHAYVHLNELEALRCAESSLRDLVSTPGRMFTPRQIDFLRDNQGMSIRELSTLLGRSPRSIMAVISKKRAEEGVAKWPYRTKATLARARNAFPRADPADSPIRIARKARGWRLADLSERTGIDVAQLSRLERGQRGSSVDTLLRVTSALGISMERAIGPDGSF